MRVGRLRTPSLFLVVLLLAQIMSLMQPCRFKAYDVSSCTADIPGSYDCAEMQKENQHGEDRVPLNAVFSDIFSVPKEESAFVFDVVQSFYRKPDGLVRNYIHRSDGKKRA